MTTVETSVVIEAPMEKVYDFTTDWRNIERYFVYVHEVEPTTEETRGKGARLSLKVKFLGLMMKSEWECIEQTDNEGWSFNATLMGLTAVKRWRFASVGDSTRVTFTLEYKPSPPIIGHIMDVLLIKPQWEKLYKRSFPELKQLIEAETIAAPDNT